MFRSLDRSSGPVPTLRVLRTADYGVLVQSGGPMFLPRRYRSFHVIGVPLSAEYPLVRGEGARRWTGRLSLGDVSLHAAGRGERIAWPDGAACLYINLRPAFVARGAGIETHHRVRDPVVYDIGMALVAAIAAGARESIADGLMSALGTHLAGRYLSTTPPPVLIGRRLLDDVLDEIREGSDAATSIERLARTCGLTRAHFSRRFRDATDGSPHALVLSSRVERAKFLLTERRRSISEAAYESGFVDQSHLSQTFGRLVGMTPARFRELHALIMRRVSSTNLQDRT